MTRPGLYVMEDKMTLPSPARHGKPSRWRQPTTPQIRDPERRIADLETTVEVLVAEQRWLVGVVAGLVVDLKGDSR